MANKNTVRRKREYRKYIKANGGFEKPVFKSKKKKFPEVGEKLSMIEQHKIFHGQWSKFN